MTPRQRKPSRALAIFNIFATFFKEANKRQSEIERLDLLNRQRAEDIILKKQRQREMEQKIIKIGNEIVIQELTIDIMRGKSGVGSEFRTEDYDPPE